MKILNLLDTEIPNVFTTKKWKPVAYKIDKSIYGVDSMDGDTVDGADGGTDGGD